MRKDPTVLDALHQLKKEIILNSLFLKDYKNTLFIKEKTACSFFDSYIEYLHELASDDGFNSDDVIDVINKYDTLDNLYNYYSLYESDPLIQDNIIASKPINNSDAMVIYKIIDYGYNQYLYAGFLCLSGLYIKSSKIKKYKLYDSYARGYYFNYKNKRYYINDFLKVDY